MVESAACRESQYSIVTIVTGRMTSPLSKVHEATNHSPKNADPIPGLIKEFADLGIILSYTCNYRYLDNCCYSNHMP
jgi:hypothetical protein